MERPKKNPQRVRTRYTKEFKLEAVRLLKLGQNNKGQTTVSELKILVVGISRRN